MPNQPFKASLKFRFGKDEDILRAIQSGDETAIDYLYQTYYQPIKLYVLQNSGNADDARDVFQDGVVAFWVNVREGNFQLTSEATLATYFTRICKNRWLDKIRSADFKRKASLDAVTEPMATDDVLSRMISTEEVSQLAVLFGKLGDKCQQILRSFYYEKQSLEKIADTLGMQTDSLKNEKYRCMMRLKELYHPRKS